MWPRRGKGELISKLVYNPLSKSIPQHCRAGFFAQRAQADGLPQANTQEPVRRSLKDTFTRGSDGIRGLQRDTSNGAKRFAACSHFFNRNRDKCWCVLTSSLLLFLFAASQIHRFVCLEDCSTTCPTTGWQQGEARLARGRRKQFATKQLHSFVWPH